jgi:uncharacterized protein YjdB
MKTCRFFLIILSLSVWLAGCKEEDDGKVVLQGLAVNPTSMSLAANDSKTIAASPLPPNSSDLVFNWKMSKEGVVSLLTTDGPTVWVSGVAQGEVIVTVTCNGESIDVPVTVFPANLRRISINESKLNMYTNNDEFKYIELVATPDPLDAPDVEFEWLVEPEGVVSLSDSTGASVVVTAEKIGAAIITVQSGTISKKVSVTVTREARLDYLSESVVGQWKFDDVNDYGKATKGNNLEITGQIRSVMGPSGGNYAIEGTRYLADLRAKHGLTGDSLDNFTILWDARYPSGELNTGNYYYAGYWNGTYTNDASLFMVYRTADNYNASSYDYLMGTTSTVNAQSSLCVGAGTYYLLEGPYPYPDYSPWMRIVMTITRINENNVRMDVWKDGVKIMDNLMKGSSQYKLTEDDWIYFLTDGGNLNQDFTVGDGDDRPHPLAQVAIWGFAMNNAEVRMLGTVETEF